MSWTQAALAPWRALEFDVNAPPARPDWLVEGLLARGTVNILSGDTSSAKSFVSLALAMAVLDDEPWLGRPVRADSPAGTGRVLIVEGEMPRWEVEDRLRGFGVRNDHWPRLAYLDKSQAVSIDLPEHRERLLTVLDAFRPDLVVLDTIFSLTCQTDVNSPSEVARFYAETLRPLAQRTTLLALHHENKRTESNGGDPEQRMTGARQWAAQADRHLILTATDRGNVETRTLENGNARQSYALRLDSGKTRGSEKPKLRLSLDSETDANGRRVWIDLRVTGAAESGSSLVRMVRELLAREGELDTAQIMAAGLSSSRRTLERALATGIAAGEFHKVGHGRYGPVTDSAAYSK